MASLKQMPTETVGLDERDFDFFRRRIFELSGIHLTRKKRDLVSSRLRSHIERSGLGSFSEYRKWLEGRPPADPENQNFINLLTTNKTDFFREPKHFSHIAETLIPSWISQKKTSVHVWSCASSTGEEPYTLALVLNQHLPKSIAYQVLATDIDTDVLEVARNGVYPISRRSEIPLEYALENTVIGKGNAQGWFKVSDPIRDAITFRQHNLTQSTFISDKPFDLIMCRNVLIYFSEQTIKDLMIKIHKSLKEDGSLIIGHSESIQSWNYLFKAVHPSIFRKI